MRVQALAALTVLVAASARADTLLTIKARLETTPPQPVTGKSRDGAEWQLWVGDHRLREDTPKLSTSVIRRFDRKKLYMIDHRARTYAEMDLPFDPAAQRHAAQPAGPAAGGDIAKESPPRQKVRMTVSLTDERRRIGSWNARKLVVVTHGPLGEATAVKWMSAEVGVDEGTLNRWQAEAVVLPPGSLDPETVESQRRLDAIPGYPVLEETRSSLGPGETEFRWHRELVSAETKEPPAGLYDPPAGYTKVAADQLNFLAAEKPADHR